MPNQINSTNTPKKYDAGDLADVYSCAESDMQWMNTAISHIRKEVKRLNKLAENGKEITQYHFADLIHHIDMYEYVSEERHAHHAEQAERYSKEWEKIKGGSHNA